MSNENTVAYISPDGYRITLSDTQNDPCFLIKVSEKEGFCSHCGNVFPVGQTYCSACKTMFADVLDAQDDIQTLCDIEDESYRVIDEVETEQARKIAVTLVNFCIAIGVFLLLLICSFLFSIRFWGRV